MSNHEPTKRYDPSERRRPRRLADADAEAVAFPLVWIVIGGLAGLIVIGLIGLGVVNFVRQSAITPTPQVLPPLVEPVEAAPTFTPTPAQVEAPAVVTDTTSAEQPAAPAEGETPEPPAASGELVVDGYAKVVGTEGAGLSMRAGPGRNNARIGLAEESDDVLLLLLDGPREDENAEDYVWWYIRHPDGTEGWVVEDFIVPAENP